MPRQAATKPMPMADGMLDEQDPHEAESTLSKRPTLALLHSMKFAYKKKRKS